MNDWIKSIIIGILLLLTFFSLAKYGNEVVQMSYRDCLIHDFEKGNWTRFHGYEDGHQSNLANWLCYSNGYDSCDPDACGSVQKDNKTIRAFCYSGGLTNDEIIFNIPEKQLKICKDMVDYDYNYTKTRGME